MPPKNLLETQPTISPGDALDASVPNIIFNRIIDYHNVVCDFETLTDPAVPGSGTNIATYSANLFGGTVVANTILGSNIFDCLEASSVFMAGKLSYINDHTVRIEAPSFFIANSIAREKGSDYDIDITDPAILIGTETASTLYNIFVVADAVALDYTVKVTSASVPLGCTNYLKIGTFWNDASKNIVRSSVKLLDGKHESYELENRETNRGELPSLAYFDAHRVTLSPCYVNINGEKRYLSAAIDLDIVGNIDDSVGVEQSSKWYYIYLVADTPGAPDFTWCYVEASEVTPATATNYFLLAQIYNDAAGDFVESTLQTFDYHYQMIRGEQLERRIEYITNEGDRTGKVTFEFSQPINNLYSVSLQEKSFAACLPHPPPLPLPPTCLNRAWYLWFTNTANDITIHGLDEFGNSFSGLDSWGNGLTFTAAVEVD